MRSLALLKIGSGGKVEQNSWQCHTLFEGPGLAGMDGFVVSRGFAVEFDGPRYPLWTMTTSAVPT